AFLPSSNVAREPPPPRAAARPALPPRPDKTTPAGESRRERRRLRRWACSVARCHASRDGGSKGGAEYQVDEARLLVAAADVDPRHQRFAERDPRAASVAPAKLVVGRRDRGDRLAELSGDLPIGHKHSTRIAEGHAVDLNLPDVVEIKVEELQPIFRVHHH